MKGASYGLDSCYWSMLLISIAQAVPVSRNETEISEGNLPKPSLDNQACLYGEDIFLDGQIRPSSNPCETCTCFPPHFLCSLRTCDVKPGCKALHSAGKCCPDYVCDCQKNGRTYGNGEKVEEPNPCNVCYCRGGEIKCAGVSCYTRTDCEPHYVPGKCCPKFDHCPAIDVPERFTVSSSEKPEPTTAVPIVKEEILIDIIQPSIVNPEKDKINSLPVDVKPNQVGTLEIIEIYPSQHPSNDFPIEKKETTPTTQSGALTLSNTEAEEKTTEVSKSEEVTTEFLEEKLVTIAEESTEKLEYNTTAEVSTAYPSETEYSFKVSTESLLVREKNGGEVFKIVTDPETIDDETVKNYQVLSTTQKNEILGTINDTENLGYSSPNESLDVVTEDYDRATGVFSVENSSEIGEFYHYIENTTEIISESTEYETEMYEDVLTPVLTTENTKLGTENGDSSEENSTDIFFERMDDNTDLVELDSVPEGSNANRFVYPTENTETTYTTITTTENVSAEVNLKELSSSTVGESIEMFNDSNSSFTEKGLRLETTVSPITEKIDSSTEISTELLDLETIESSTVNPTVTNIDRYELFIEPTSNPLVKIDSLSETNTTEFNSELRDNASNPVNGDTNSSMNPGVSIDTTESHLFTNTDSSLEVTTKIFWDFIEVTTLNPEIKSMDRLSVGSTEKLLNSEVIDETTISPVFDSSSERIKDSELTTSNIDSSFETTTEITTEFNTSNSDGKYSDSSSEATAEILYDSIGSGETPKPVMEIIDVSSEITNETMYDQVNMENPKIITLGEEMRNFSETLGAKNQLSPVYDIVKNDSGTKNESLPPFIEDETRTNSSLFITDKTSKPFVDDIDNSSLTVHENFENKKTNISVESLIVHEESIPEVNHFNSSLETSIVNEKSTYYPVYRKIDSITEATVVHEQPTLTVVINGKYNTSDTSVVHENTTSKTVFINNSTETSVVHEGSNSNQGRKNISSLETIIVHDNSILNSEIKKIDSSTINPEMHQESTPNLEVKFKNSSRDIVPVHEKSILTKNSTEPLVVHEKPTPNPEIKKIDSSTATLAEILLKWLQSKKSKIEAKNNKNIDSPRHVTNSAEDKKSETPISLLSALTNELIKIVKENETMETNENISRNGETRSLDFDNSKTTDTSLEVYSRDIENLAEVLNKDGIIELPSPTISDEIDTPIHLRYPYTDESLSPVLSMISDQLQFLRVGEEQPMYVNVPQDDKVRYHHRHGVMITPTSSPITVNMVKVIDGVSMQNSKESSSKK